MSPVSGLCIENALDKHLEAVEFSLDLVIGHAGFAHLRCHATDLASPVLLPGGIVRSFKQRCGCRASITVSTLERKGDHVGGGNGREIEQV
jgi:hypothetical protein